MREAWSFSNFSSEIPFHRIRTETWSTPEQGKHSLSEIPFHRIRTETFTRREALEGYRLSEIPFHRIRTETRQKVVSHRRPHQRYRSTELGLRQSREGGQIVLHIRDTVPPN